MPAIHNNYTLTVMGNGIHLKVEVEGINPVVAIKTIAFLPKANTGFELTTEGTQVRCGDTVIAVSNALKSGGRVDSWNSETDKETCFEYLRSTV